MVSHIVIYVHADHNIVGGQGSSSLNGCVRNERVTSAEPVQMTEQYRPLHKGTQFIGRTEKGERLEQRYLGGPQGTGEMEAGEG